MTDFQTSVNQQPAPAVAGNFASVNPRFVVDAGPSGLVAGPSGATVGAFHWVAPPDDPNGFPALANPFGAGPVAGLLAREQQALITLYLAESSMTVPAGFPVTLFSGGDFWVKNSGSGQAQVGQKAYANFSNGLVTFAATASPTTGATSTSSAIAASTFSVTGSIANNVLTVTAVGSGTVVAGAAISGSGIASGSTIVSQLTPLLSGEAAGGIGRYYVSIPEQTVASTTVSGTYGTLTVGGSLTGTFGVGNALTGSGGATVSAGSIITALGTGTGGAGTYIVNLTQSSGTGTINATSNVETKWVAMSSGLAGELVKISDHVLG